MHQILLSQQMFYISLLKNTRFEKTHPKIIANNVHVNAIGYKIFKVGFLQVRQFWYERSTLHSVDVEWHGDSGLLLEFKSFFFKGALDIMTTLQYL